jgi:predicted DsbA family dithiol-disulfide isomerase
MIWPGRGVAQAVHIDIWSDIACPWCYLGLTRFAAALAGFEHSGDVEVRLRSFQLDPTLPESYPGSEIDYLAVYKGIPVETAQAMTAQVAAAGAPDGVSFDFDALQVANSRRAHRLLHEARRADPSGQLAWRLELALFDAHFRDGESISDPAVLVRLARAQGMDAAAATAALDSAERDEAVEADIAKAASWGIRGVPFFVFEEKYAISGAQPVSAFGAALDQVWAERSPAPQPLG